MPLPTRTVLVAGERRRAALVHDDADVAASEEEVAFAYGLVAGDRPGFVSVEPAPVLERPLRLARVLPQRARGLVPDVPLVAPFGRRPRKGFRELSTLDPRVSRLWGRFSVDVRVAVERDAKFFGARVFDRPERGYRVFIVEDGDRYAIRAMCVFATSGPVGYVMELLHDRTLEGMRGASHVLGLALRAMSDAGAEVARALALPHSGAAPTLLLHAFRRRPGLPLRVRAVDPELDEIVTRPDLWYASYLDFELA